jgi:hypothetical protein
MATMIAVMALTNLQNTASLKVELASGTCSLATMAIAFRESTFAVRTFNFQHKAFLFNRVPIIPDGDNDCLDNSDEDNRHQCSK